MLTAARPFNLQSEPEPLVPLEGDDLRNQHEL